MATLGLAWPAIKFSKPNIYTIKERKWQQLAQ